MAAVGVGLITSAIAFAHVGLPRGAQVASAFVGVPVLLVGIVWWVTAVVTWQAVRGPWWAGTDQDAAQVLAVARLLTSLGPDQSHWVKPSIQAANSLRDDNTRLCARMDRIAYRASRRGSGSESELLHAMWKSLLEGRERLGQLCREIRATAGHALVERPLGAGGGDEQILSDLSAFADRVKALDAARRELEPDQGVADQTAAPASGHPDILSLLSARAPDLVEPAARLRDEARRQKQAARASIQRWQAETAQLPVETPASERALFVAGRREAIKERNRFIGRVQREEDALLQAAVHLAPPLPPAPVPPPEYERGSVEAADGMISALREMRRRAGQEPAD